MKQIYEAIIPQPLSQIKDDVAYNRYSFLSILVKENAFLILESFKRWVGFCVRGSFSQCSFPEVPVKSFYILFGKGGQCGGNEK